MTTHWISMRNVARGAFEAEPAKAPSYLSFDDAATPTPDDRIGLSAWVKAVLAGLPQKNDKPCGDIVFYIHGYNNGIDEVAARHRLMQAGLTAAGFPCTVISFDWPAGTIPLAYLDDRHKAKKTAFGLVSGGIQVFANLLEPGCAVNLHIVAHSMGALVLRDAFDDADDTTAAQVNWTAGQVALLAGDVSAASFSRADKTTESLFRHAYRVTNYFNRLDEPLQISNAKRVGFSPRIGRVGLPEDVPDKAVDIDCTERYRLFEAKTDALPDGGFVSHSWYFYDQTLLADLALTLAGKIDRAAFPTRDPLDRNNRYRLK
jgi:esterase/lipase superfamily enzyme